MIILQHFFIFVEMPSGIFNHSLLIARILKMLTANENIRLAHVAMRHRETHQATSIYVPHRIEFGKNDF